jgi:diguanylate cyclase (GGDEF)-like protein/PAS domain S-box-containing protein
MAALLGWGDDSAPQMRPTPEFRPGRRLSAVRILLLEDDPVYAELIQANLSRTGHAELVVQHVGTLAQALEHLDAGGCDLVMTDLNLPDSRGLETLESLTRHTDRLVIVLTGDTNEGLRDAAIECGAYDLVGKDGLSREELERLIRLAAMQAKTFRSLRESEARFRGLTELSADWYWEQDSEYRLTFMSAHMGSKTGLDASAYIGRRRWDQPALNLTERDWEKHRAQLDRREPFKDFEMHRKADDGRSVWLSLTGEPVFGEGRRFLGYRGVGRDISERKLAEEDKRRIGRMYAALGGINEAIMRAQSADELFRRTCEIAVESGNFLRAIVRIANREAGLLELTAMAGQDSEVLRRNRMPIPAPGEKRCSLAGSALRDGRSQILRDVRSHPDAATLTPYSVAMPEVISAGAFPLRVEGECVGVLLLHGTGVDSFDGEMAELIQRMADNLSFGLERKRAEEALQRFRLAMDTSADMILLTDRATMRHVDVNSTACKLLGYSREELLAMGPQDILPMARAEFEQAYDRLIADPSQPSGMKSFYRCKDGTRLPFESTRRLLRSGDTWLVAAISRDIRERIAAEEALRASEERFRGLTQLTTDMYWEQDDQYRFTSISDQSPDWLRSGRGPMIGRKRWDRVYLNMTEADWQAHRAVLDARQAFRDLELGRLNEEGEPVWVSVSGEPVFEGGVFKGYRGVGRDITQRKREEALLALEHDVVRCVAEADSIEAGLQSVLRHVCETENWESGMYWRVDEAAGALRFSESWCGQDSAIERYVASYNDVEFKPGMGYVGRVWQSREPIWATDIANDPRMVRSAQAREAGVRGTFVFPVMAEGRVIGVLAFSTRRARQRNERLLQAVHVIGSQIGQFLQRKQAEMEVRASEERFRSLTELSSDFYWESDTEHRVSRAAGSNRIRVVSPGQIGKARWETPSTYPDTAGWAAHRATMEAHQPFRDFEIARIDADGVERWRSISGEPVFDDAGTFRGYRGVGKDITAAKKAEAALSESEARFRSLAELSSDWYWEQDEDFRFVEQSNAYKRNQAARAPDALGRTRWEAHAASLTPEQWAAHRATLAAHLPFQDLEYQRASADGVFRWVSVSGEPIFDASGRFRGYRGIGRDITQRKREESVLQLEHRVTRCLAEAPDVENGLQSVIRAICEAYDWRLGRYWRVDDEAGLLRFAGTWAVTAEEAGQSATESRDVVFAKGKGLAGRVWQTGQPEWVTDTATDARVARKALTRDGMRGAFVFPVTSGRRVLGVFGFCSREVREPDERALQALGVIGAQIGQFLERKRVEEEQRTSRQLLNNIVENIPTAVQLKSVHDGYRVVMWNKAAEKMYGVPRAEAIGRNVFDLWPREKAERMNAADLDLVARGGTDDFPNREAQTKDRGTIHVHMRKVPLLDASGKASHLLVVADDITDRQREERLLRLEHSVARVFAEAKPVPETLGQVMREICESEGWDCGRYFRVDTQEAAMRFEESWCTDNEAMRRFAEGSVGVSFKPGEGLVGSVWQSGEPIWVEDTSRDPRVAMKSLAAQAGLHGAFLFPVVFESRVIGVLSISSREVRKPDERLLRTMRVIGVQLGQFLQRRKAEEALSESEARYRGTFELAATGISHTGLDGRLLRVNRKLCELFGYAEQELIGRSVKDLSHPEDRNAVGMDRLEQLRAGKIPSLTVEKRYLRRDGSSLWVNLTIALVRNAEQQPEYEIAMFEDISARKEQERELRRFRLAMDMSLDAIYLTDPVAMRFVDVNQAACQRMGYTREQLLQMGPHDLLAADRAKLEREYAEVIAAGEQGTRTEHASVTRSGERRWTELDRRALPSSSGPLIVTVARDITGRKVAEQRQAAHARFQEKIASFGASALGRRENAELIEDALRTVAEAMPVDIVAYLEPDAGEREVIVRGIVGAAGGEPATLAAYRGTDALALPLEQGELVIVDRTDGAPPLVPFAWAESSGCAALVPVHGDNRVQGVLCALSKGKHACGTEESKFLVTAASVLSAGLRRIDSEGRLAFLAQFDPLTGLPNRALLADRFSQMIVQARRHDKPLGVLFIDLDQFKMVNDSLGHAGGDDLLKETARRLQASVRPGDTVARISGDEFAVILGDLARADDAALVAQKIIDQLAMPVRVRGQEVFVTASIGIAAFPTDGDDAEALLGAADAAMYRAKQAGRNAYQFFTADINQRTRARAQLGTELRRALERDEFALVYQPKVDLASGRICAAEALLRWRHPERGMVSPAEFIPVLEETGLIVQVGEWVLRRTCADLKAWQAQGLELLPVAVNLSARQFRQGDLDARIRDLVRGAGVDPSLIELEVTESQVMQDPEHANRVMRALSDAGIRVAIDDFGTGYSSLSYLTRFPVAALKIDRSFVADVLEDQADAAIVRTIIDMAHTLGFIVVAEGVETEAQAAFLRGLGCEQAQGYYFAKPMPEAELRSLLSGSRLAPRQAALPRRS